MPEEGQGKYIKKGNVTLNTKKTASISHHKKTLKDDEENAKNYLV